MVGLLEAVRRPPEPLEEADVGDLDVRPHDPAAVLGSGRYREPDEIRAELVDAELGLDREPVPLPDVAGPVQGIEAYRADDACFRRADEVDRVVPLVELVVIGDREDGLLDDEHLVSDSEVVGKVLRSEGNPALGPEERDIV